MNLQIRRPSRDELSRRGREVTAKLGQQIRAGRAKLGRQPAVREGRAQAKRVRAEAKRVRAEAKALAGQAKTAARRAGDAPWVTPKRVAVGIAGVGAGAVGAYFLDSENGKRRRHAARDKSLSFVKRWGADVRRVAAYRKDQVAGLAHRATGAGEPPSDDATLADKVRSEVLRPADVPSGAINVNAERGVVFLRGQLEDSEQVDRLIEATAAVEGVAAVESLLHLPGEPAPSKGDGAVATAEK